MRKIKVNLCLLALSILSLAFTPGNQVAQAWEATDHATMAKEIDELRSALVVAFEKQDIDEMLALVHPDIIVTWQNAEVSRGPEELKAYFNRMMSGPESVVLKVTGNPVVEGRKFYGDHVISYGQMNDEFLLRGEKEPLKFNSRFSALVVRQEGVLKLAGLHLSVNAFDNAVLGQLTSSLKLYGTFAGIALVLLGMLIGKSLRKKSV